MKLKILVGLVLSVALLAMSGCGGGDGGGGVTGPTGPTASTVIASAGTGGTISPPGVSTVLPTFSVAYTITPDPGYTVSDVVIDGFSFGAITSFEFGTGGHTIHATFTNRPKTAIVTLVTINPLTPDSIVGGIAATLLYSENLGLSITQVAPYNVVASGNGTGSAIFTNMSTAGQVGINLTNATGIRTGEFATVTFKLFSSVAGPIANGNVPAPGNFAISSGAVVTGLDAAIIPGVFPFIGPVIIK